MYFLIYGNDSYKSKATLTAMRERFSVQRDSSGLNSAYYRYKEAKIDTVAEAIFATPFLAEKKLVVLEGFLKAPAAEQKKIVEYLEKKPESTTVIFFEGFGAKEIKKSALHEILVSQKFTSEHSLLSGAQLSNHVKNVCKQNEVTITPRAIQALLSVVSDNAWRLEKELEKLCAYASTQDTKEISEEIVHEMIEATQEDSVFEFLDACTEGRKKKAVELLEGLFTSGMSEIQVTALLTKQFRTLIAVKDLMERGTKDKYIIAKEVGVHHYPASKAMVTCRRFSPGALKMFHSRLLDIDKSMKTGGGDRRVLLNIFTTRLTTA